MEHAAFALKLRDATNSRTVAKVVDCFAEDYVNQTPAHPARGFTGKDQVRRNWAQIFAAVPDHTATLIASAQDGDTVWTEWEMRGTRADGAPHLMCGAIVFTVRDELACAARFYLEPADDPRVSGAGAADVDADAAVHRILS
jgi:ketosteroid isomerase-like protein